jgi:hypothetical protein
MDPIPLNVDFSGGAVVAASSPEFPHVWLNRLRDVDIPEEGEIRFRYSRKKKVETETRTDETCDYELCLKAITDICDCADKEPDGMDDPEAALDRLAEDLKDEDMVDESEDDNPDKY